MKAHILLVEDDNDIVHSLSELLQREGMQVTSSATQNDAIRLAYDANYHFDLVLLDISLAQGNGFAACSAIKEQNPKLPIVFLTASSDEFNTVAGLAMGADDYIAKPFRPKELLARIHVILRRNRPNTESILQLKDVFIDLAKARVTKAGKDIDLSAIEYRLLLCLASKPGALVTREAMREALWNDANAYVGDNTISVYIKRLRQKLEDNPAEPELILTVRGRGYKTPAPSNAGGTNASGAFFSPERSDAHHNAGNERNA